MSELFKSKLGMLLAGIYLLMVLTCLLYINLINNQNVIVALILIILVAPWFYLFAYFLNEPLGINFMHEVAGSKNVDYRTIVDNVEIALSVLINACILYLLGFLLTKAFKHLSSTK